MIEISLVTIWVVSNDDYVHEWCWWKWLKSGWSQFGFVSWWTLWTSERWLEGPWWILQVLLQSTIMVTMMAVMMVVLIPMKMNTLIPTFLAKKPTSNENFNTFCLFLKDWGAMQGPIQESYGTPGLSHSSYQISFVCVFFKLFLWWFDITGSKPNCSDIQSLQQKWSLNIISVGAFLQSKQHWALLLQSANVWEASQGGKGASHGGKSTYLRTLYVIDLAVNM